MVVVRRGMQAVVVVVACGTAVDVVEDVLVDDGLVVDGVVNTIPVWGASVACCTVLPSRST